MKCQKCKKTIKAGQPYYPTAIGRFHASCLSESKRSGAPQAGLPVRSGVELIAEERKRQVSKEGWTPEHDDSHKGKQMAKAAESYLCVWTYPDKDHPDAQFTRQTYGWPWAKKWWKPSSDPIRNLVKAGALIAAEIDRLQRARARAALAVQRERAIRRNDKLKRSGEDQLT